MTEYKAALKKACSALADFTGTCPHDLHGWKCLATLDCELCKSQLTECWEQYFIQADGEPSALPRKETRI